MNQAQRRAHNLALALNCVRCSVPVFPVDGVTKAPLNKLFHTLDTAITPEQKKEMQDDGVEPKRAGSTLSEKIVKLWWRQNPDAVPALSGGLFGVVVFDCDVNDGSNGKRVKDGVALFDGWWAENVALDVPHPITVTPSGGRHHYLAAKDIGCGVLTHLDTDVKGIGGYVIAPGSIRVDGKQYAPAPGAPDLLASVRDIALPPCPEPLAKVYADRASMRQHGEDSEPRIAAAKRELEAGAPDDLAVLDLTALRAKDAEFRDVMERPTGDHSRDRFTIARCLLREFGDACTVHHLSNFYDEWDHSGSFVSRKQSEGEYDNREIARNFVRAQGSGKVVDGASFGDVTAEATVSNLETVGADPYDQATDEKPGTPKGKSALTFLTAADILHRPLRAIDWLIEDLLEAETSILLYGQPGSGKTAVTVDMLLHISQGLAWNGRKTKGCPVLLVCPEGPNGLERRVRAWFARKQRDGVEGLRPERFVLVLQPVDLFASDAGLNAIGTELVRRSKEGDKVGLVVFDTLRRVMPGGSENDQGDTGTVMARLDRLRASCRCAGAFVHHGGKDKDKGASGSTNIVGSVDTALVFEKKKKTDKHGLILPDKLRDGDMPEGGIRYDLVGEEIGLDETGKPVRAVVAIVEAGKPKHEASDGSAMGAVEDPDDEAVEMGAGGETAAGGAAERHSGEAFGSAVEDDAAEMGGADPERVGLVVETVRELTEGQAVPGVTRNAIEAALNAKLRKAHGRKGELGPRSVQRLLADMVEDGVLILTGAARSRVYRLGP